MNSGLFLSPLIQEDLAAIAAGIVGIVAILGAGCGLGLRQRHGVAQGGEVFILHCGLLPVLLILVGPATGVAEVVGVVASGGTCGGDSGDEVGCADVGQTVVEVGGGEGFILTADFDLLPGDFIAAVVDVL